MSHNWRSAFLAQARSDFRILEILSLRQGVERCHCLHYLQMAAEKLAKAFLTKGAAQPQTTHHVLVRFLRRAETVRELQRACRTQSVAQFRQYLKGLMSVAQEVEALVPQKNSVRPNPEYPWVESGVIHAPCEYAFPGWPGDAPKLIKIKSFIRVCLQQA